MERGRICRLHVPFSDAVKRPDRQPSASGLSALPLRVSAQESPAASPDAQQRHSAFALGRPMRSSDDVRSYTMNPSNIVVCRRFFGRVGRRGVCCFSSLFRKRLRPEPQFPCFPFAHERIRQVSEAIKGAPQKVRFPPFLQRKRHSVSDASPRLQPHLCKRSLSKNLLRQGGFDFFDRKRLQNEVMIGAAQSHSPLVRRPLLAFVFAKICFRVAFRNVVTRKSRCGLYNNEEKR